MWNHGNPSLRDRTVGSAGSADSGITLEDQAVLSPDCIESLAESASDSLIIDETVLQDVYSKTFSAKLVDTIVKKITFADRQIRDDGFASQHGIVTDAKKCFLVIYPKCTGVEPYVDEIVAQQIKTITDLKITAGNNKQLANIVGVIAELAKLLQACVRLRVMVKATLSTQMVTAIEAKQKKAQDSVIHHQKKYDKYKIEAQQKTAEVISTFHNVQILLAERDRLEPLAENNMLVKLYEKELHKTLMAIQKTTQEIKLLQRGCLGLDNGERRRLIEAYKKLAGEVSEKNLRWLQT